MTTKRMTNETDRKKYTVVEKVQEAPGVFTLKFTSGETPPYVPGQFITVYFPELGTPEGKAYSISSAPDEGALAITVKQIGEFSNRLCSLEPGDTVEASAPCGYFFSESNTSTLVMLAAGIGISPFRSMMRGALKKNPARKLLLLCSSRAAADIIFRETLDGLQAAETAVRVEYFITREEPVPQGMVRGRMTPEAVIQAVGAAPDPEFFICGSIPFVRDLWRGLKWAGVSEDRLYTEAFFSH